MAPTRRVSKDRKKPFTAEADKYVTNSEQSQSDQGLDELITAELHALRKGRGIQAADLGRRIGAHLRELAAGTALSGSDIAGTRRQLIPELGSRGSSLSEDWR